MAISLDNVEAGRVSGEETRAILAQAMSAQAALQSMGIGMGDDFRRQEQAEFDAEMEKKNAEIEARIAAEKEAGKPQAKEQPAQKPVKSRKRRGIVKQTTAAQAAVQQPAAQPDDRMTLADRELIESVKRDSVNKVMAARRMFGMSMPPAAPQEPEAPATVQPAPVAPAETPEPPIRTVNWAQAPQQQEYRPIPYQALQPAPQPYQEMQPVQPPEYTPVAPAAPAQQPPFQPRVTPMDAERFHQLYMQQPVPGDRPVQEAVTLEAPQQYAGNPAEETPEEDDYIDFDNPPMVKSQFDPTVMHPDYEAWTVVRGLPSRCLAYGGPIRGQSFKTVDLLMLDDIDDEDENENITAVFAKRLRGVNPEDILYCDEENLMHWLRASSFPKVPLYSVAFECPHCSEAFPADVMDTVLGGVNYRHLSFKCDSDPVEVLARHAVNATPENPIGYVKFMMYDGRECDIYLRRRMHERIVREYIDKWEAKHDETYPSAWLFPTKLAALVEIEECPEMEDKVNFILEYPGACRGDFYKAIADASLSSSTFVNLKCPSCGGAVEAPYPFLKKLFLASI